MEKETINYRNYPQITDGTYSAEEGEIFPICKATGDICVNGKIIITPLGANFWKSKPRHMACAPCPNFPKTPDAPQPPRVTMTRTTTTTTETTIIVTRKI